MAHLQESDKSINLKATELEDSFDNGEDEEEENEIKNLRGENRVSSVWKTGGDAKNEVLWKLEKLFSSFVTKLEDEERNEISYKTLLSAHKSVTRATKLLSDNDNYTTRDFTIHIANKKWVTTTLVPLMELSVEDRDLTMRCCRLLMVLTRNLNYDAKVFSTLKVMHKKGKETKEEALIRFRKETTSKSNAKQQISAFLSFKEAICTEKCSTAITNVLYHLWKTEKEERKEREEKRVLGTANEFTKREVATCLSYIRRILQVDSVPLCSKPGEVLMAKSVHDKLVVQLRGALLIVPVICAELADKYNDVWLTDILRIIFYILRGHDPKDLFKVWKENCLIGDDLNFDKENVMQPSQSQKNKETKKNNLSVQDKKTVYASGNAPGQQDSFPLPQSFASRNPVVASKGILGGLLEKERAERAKKAEEMTRHSRFGGQYRSSMASITVSLELPPESPPSPGKSAGRSNRTLAKLSSRPFTADNVPQAQARRNPKSITFAGVDPYVTMAGKDYMCEDGQRACVVAASLAERICSGMGLKQLVMRVGVDRVREEGLITTDKEIVFFDVVTSLLKYNRLKIVYDKAQYENKVSANSLGHGLLKDFNTEPRRQGPGQGPGQGQGSSGGVNGKQGADTSAGAAGWIPDLHNVINALDTMSFRRVFESLETLQTTQVKRFADMVSPLALYKEMMCYLRILLESADETHNEFAIARLYSIFYTTSERKDPLPRILSEWTPGVYSRKHLDTLVELVHETLKTLDTAACKYGNPNAEKKKTKQKNSKKTMDMEQYMVGCLSFDVSEYFKRYLATNATVRMFTRLLSYHASNDVSVNHYAFCYLQRLCSFRLQQDFVVPPRPVRGYNGLSDPSSVPLSATSSVGGALAPVVTEHEDALTLGHMLFNITTLSVFTDVLSETQTTKTKVMEPLIRLIKSVIRRFERAVQKNHLLLSEILFQHAHAQNFIMEIDSVYEAPAYAKYHKSYPEGAMDKDNDREGNKGGDKYGDEEDSDGSEERGERASSAAGASRATSKSNYKSDKKASKEEDRDDEDDEEEEEFNEADYSNQERITKQSLAAAKRRTRNEKKSGKNRWKRDVDSDSDTEQEEGSDDEVPNITEKSNGRLRKGKSSAPAAATATSTSPSSSSIKADKSDSDSDSNNLHVSSDTESVDSSGNKNVENSKRRIKDAKSKSNRHKRDNKLPSPAARETRKATIKWTAEEDRILKEQFSLFRGSRSVFEVISMDTDLMAIGNNRTALAVGRRVRDLHLTSQMDHPDEGEEEESTGRDVSAAPINFGNSDDENDDSTARQDVTEGFESSAPGSKKSSLSDRLKDWEEDEDQEDRQAMKESKKDSLPVRKRPLSSLTVDTSKKRKEVSEDDELPQRGDRDRERERGGDEDTEATQQQSQIRTRPDKIRKLQKKETKGRSGESDSDDELFSDRTESLLVASENAIAQDTSLALSSDEAKIVVNSLRSRTTIVDSDED